MDLELKGRVALVSGSTAGIGLAIVESLAREGVEQVVALVPRVDILVNNVGIFEPKPFEEIPDEDWLRLFDVNVMSGVRLSRHYLRGMREKDWGRIVFVSSESALQIPVEMIHYGVTKTAQLSVARGIAEGLRGTNITANSVLPGPTRSEGVEVFLKDLSRQQGVDVATVEREFFKSARPSSLIQRFARTEEVADLVAFVCSPRASGINGTALRVDGGVVRAVA